MEKRSVSVRNVRPARNYILITYLYFTELKLNLICNTILSEYKTYINFIGNLNKLC